MSCYFKKNLHAMHFFNGKQPLCIWLLVSSWSIADNGLFSNRITLYIQFHINNLLSTLFSLLLNNTVVPFHLSLLCPCEILILFCMLIMLFKFSRKLPLEQFFLVKVHVPLIHKTQETSREAFFLCWTCMSKYWTVPLAYSCPLNSSKTHRTCQ